jgi:hypothetical protein
VAIATFVDEHLPGAVAHLEANIAAAGLRLDPDEVH